MSESIVTHPRVYKLADDLGLLPTSDVMGSLKSYAIERVSTLVGSSPMPTLFDLLAAVAEELRVELVWVHGDSDVRRAASAHPELETLTTAALIDRFCAGELDAVTIPLVDGPIDFCWRAMILVQTQGRVGRRAYLAAWREIAAIILHPRHLDFPLAEPVESAFDQAAGALAFLPELVSPVIAAYGARERGLSIAAIEQVRDRLLPGAPLFIAALGCLMLSEVPTLLATLDGPPAVARTSTRVVQIGQNSAARGMGLSLPAGGAVVPTDSVFRRVLDRASKDDELSANEVWDFSEDGHLRQSRMVSARVATREGFVFGLVSA